MIEIVSSQGPFAVLLMVLPLGVVAGRVGDGEWRGLSRVDQRRRCSFHQILLLALVALGCSSLGTTKVENFYGETVSSESLDDFIASKVKEMSIPGLSLVMINHGEVVFHRTLGYANLETMKPVSAETIFEGASISKSIFAFFAMTYVEEGRLDLDRPLHEYLPNSDLAHDKRYQTITARMILSHRSGLPNWRENEVDQQLRLKFEPGTDFEYSGEGYQYLAMVLRELERGDWQALEDAFQQRVAQPLGMDRTVFIQTPATRENKAEPYDRDRQWIDWKNHYWYLKDNGRFVAASSIHSEAADFSKWMIAVMREKLLSKQSYRILHERKSKIYTSEDGVDYYYCLGFLTGDEPYETTYFHSGSNDGFTSWYVLDMKSDWGFVLFTNSQHGETLGEQLFGFLEGEA